MNTSIRWSLPDDGHTFPIYAGESPDLMKLGSYANERGVESLYFGEQQWALSREGEARLSAETPSGTWVATGDGSSVRGSKTMHVEADRHRVSIIAETSKKFVIDIDGDYAGQFTSMGTGLRHIHVEFADAGAELPLDVQVFLSWVARCCMEARMVASTKIWTYLFLLFIPIAILYWIGFA